MEQNHPQITRLQKRKRGFSLTSPKIIVSYIFVGASCFYSGLLVGAQSAKNPANVDCRAKADAGDPPKITKVMENKIQRQEEKIVSLMEQLKKAQGKPPPPAGEAASDDTAPRFPSTINSFLGGAATVDRTAFAEQFDIGVPLQKSGRGNENVLLLYAHPDAVPLSDLYKAVEARSNTKVPDYGKDVDVATENCDTVNLILAQPGERTQCYAIMGQFRGFHIHKFMRLPESGPVERSAPLKLVNRGAQASGRLSHQVPREDQTEEYWKTLTSYLTNLNSTLQELRPHAEKSAVNNTVVVMVCECTCF
jgi:hypothetical protein